MLIRKWNYEEHTYEPYEVPDDWKCRAYTMDLSEVVNCPHCGKELPFGETYTSMEIHTNGGFGFGVCGDCYEKEWERRKEHER